MFTEKVSRRGTFNLFYTEVVPLGTETKAVNKRSGCWQPCSYRELHLLYSPRWTTHISADMFKNTFQSGFLSILYSIGSKPLQIWEKKVNGRPRRVSRLARRAKDC